MAIDPFADAPSDPEAGAHDYSDGPPAETPAPAKAAPKKAVATARVDIKPNLLPLDSGKVVATFKGGSGFDAPWIVIHASDLDDALAQVSGDNAVTLSELMDRVQTAGQHFASKGKSAAPSQRQAAPQAAQEAPPGAPPAPGPDWTFKSGFAKKDGKPWKGWMPPRGSSESPVFFN